MRRYQFKVYLYPGRGTHTLVFECEDDLEAMKLAKRLSDGAPAGEPGDSGRQHTSSGRMAIHNNNARRGAATILRNN